MKEIIVTGRTVDEAIEKAVLELNVPRDEIEFEILENPSSGFLGLGAKPAKISAKYVANDDTVDGFIKTFLDKLFVKMSLNTHSEVTLTNNIVNVTLKGDDVGVLIGRRGDTLDALQHIAQLATNKKFTTDFKIRIDSEDYRSKREKTLESLAKSIANRVIKSRGKYELEPMKSYERKIIHAALQEYNKITTYSVGEEPNRRLIVAYKYQKSVKTDNPVKTDDNIE